MSNIQVILNSTHMQTLLKQIPAEHRPWWNNQLTFWRKAWQCTKTDAFFALWDTQTRFLTESNFRGLVQMQSLNKRLMHFQQTLNRMHPLEHHPQFIRRLSSHEDRTHFLIGLFILLHSLDEEELFIWLNARSEYFSSDVCYIGKMCYTPLPKEKKRALMKRFHYEMKNGKQETPLAESLFGSFRTQIEEQVLVLESTVGQYQWENGKMHRKATVQSTWKHQNAAKEESLLGLMQRMVFLKKKGLLQDWSPPSVTLFKKKCVLFYTDFFQWVQSHTWNNDDWFHLSQINYSKNLDRSMQHIIKENGKPISLASFLLLSELSGYPLELKRWLVSSFLDFEEACKRLAECFSLFKKDDSSFLRNDNNHAFFWENTEHIIRTLENEHWSHMFSRMCQSPLPPKQAFHYHSSHNACPIEETHPHLTVLFDIWFQNGQPDKKTFWSSLPVYLQNLEPVQDFLRNYQIPYYHQPYQTQKMLQWLEDKTLLRLNHIAKDLEFMNSQSVIRRKVHSEWYHTPYHSHVTRRAEGLKLPASIRKKWDTKTTLEVDGFFLRESTELSDLLQIGEQPVYSCMNALRGQHRKCLFGYADYSKHLLLAYKQNKLLARVVLRLVKYKLNEEDKPYKFALLFDRTYTSVAEQERSCLQDALFSFAKQRADVLGVTLLLNGTYYKECHKLQGYLYVPYSENGYQYMDGFGYVMRPENYQKAHPFLFGTL